MADAAAAAATTATTATATTGAAAPWHQGLDAALLEHASNKKWNLADPKEAFAAAAKAHAYAEKALGIPHDKLLRIPEPTAAPAEHDAFWQQLGVPKEAKEYDFSGIKFKDGTALDDSFAEAMRNGLIKARVPKDAAPAVTKVVVDFLENADVEEQTLLSGNILKERETLEKSWGGANSDRFKANLFVAENALKKLADAIQMPQEQAKAAWDAISKLGGIGAAAATNMLYEMGRRMGEDRFVSLGGSGTGNLPMTREAAIAEIRSLKVDKEFGRKLLAGDVVSKERWTALHKIGYGQQAA